MEDDVEQAALVHSLVREVQAIASSITDDILQEQFVRLYIENDPQVHVEVPSVLASRGDDFKPQDLQVLKVLMDSHCACLLYTSPSPRDRQKSRMPSSA